jgi:adenylate cyclase
MASLQNRNSETRRSIILPMIAAAAVVVAVLYELPFTRLLADRADRVLLDKFHEAGRATPPREDVVVLGIDDASILLSDAWPEDFEQSPPLQAMKERYPFPRRVWAHLVDKLFAAGAKSVFLDLMFRDPSQSPEDDRLLREAVERHAGKVVLGAKFEVTQVASGDPHADLTTPTEAIAGSTAAAQTSVGILNFWPDGDQVIRHGVFLMRRSDADRAIDPMAPVIDDPSELPRPSVAMALARMVNPALSGQAPRRARLRYCAASAYQPRSLHEIFIPSMWQSNFQSGALFKDKIVLVGSVLPVEHDTFRIPSGEIFGVQLHAHALTALLSSSFLKELPRWAVWCGFVLAALLAWLAVTLIRQPVFCLLFLGLFSALVFSASVLLFNFASLEASPLPFLMGLNVCGVSGLTGRFLVQMRETRRLQRYLARYTSPELMKEMMADREGLYTTLSGVGRTVTVLFSDVRGFTSMSENMTPAEVVSQLNEYLSRMVELVFKQRGIVDKFIGDAVMALWGGTRVAQGEAGFKEDALNAVASALAMRSALAELNREWSARGKNELKFGIGIHQGPVVVGNIGSEAPHEKMDFTVIGDSVNLASRLEGLTKEYGVDLIISAVVQAHVKDVFRCRMADLVAVKGKALPVEVFAVLGPLAELAPSGLAEFEQAVASYREQNFAKALELLFAAKDAGLDDDLTHAYIERCEVLIANPPETWDGVYKMTKK